MLAAILVSGRTDAACDRNPSSAATCRVSVGEETALAAFPLLQQQFVWRWNRAATPANALEYRWMVEVGRCSDRGEFVAGDYSFDIQLFKFPGAPEKTGMITDLLRSAQKDLMRREIAGSVDYSHIDGAKVISRYTDGDVVVELHGKPQVELFAKGRPPYALLTVTIPDPGQSYTCIARVDYK